MRTLILHPETIVLTKDLDKIKVKDILPETELLGNNNSPLVNNINNVNSKSYILKYGMARTNDKPYIILGEDSNLFLESTTVKKREINCYPLVISPTIKEYISFAKSRKHLYKVKTIDRVIFEKDDLPYAYYLGLWLGDGNNRSTEITNIDLEVIEYLKDFCKQNSLIYHLKKDSEKQHALVTKRGKKNPLVTFLRKYNILQNKRIPKEYLLSNEKNRLQLLAGLIDSDGHFNKGYYYDITLKVKDLVNDIALLVGSLGFNFSLNTREALCSNCKDVIKQTYYRIGFSGKSTDIPCLIERKKANIDIKRNNNRSGFKLIEDEEINMIKIQLDGNLVTDRFLIL